MALELIHVGFNLYSDSQWVPDLVEQVLPTTFWLAQFEDNLGANFTEAWANFIESGQVWALLIGFGIGYAFRGLTSY
jgi:hypothetical protein